MKTIIILGMHRSCTSLIAKGLCCSDNCSMGMRLLGPNTGNKFGHFEDVNFVSMNENILSMAGGSWDNPPSEEKIIEAGIKLQKEIKNLVKSSGKSPVWGWKDPRTTLTIRCYMPYLINPIFVPCFREPKKVAKSLTIRDGSDFNKNLELIKKYNKRLLHFLTEQHL